MASSKRLVKELTDLRKEPVDGITGISQNKPLNTALFYRENVYKWTAKMKGPQSTPYLGGVFQLAIDFPIEYPFKGPKIRFLTPIYHPNVDNEGNLCVGVLKAEAWKPSTKAATILMSIQQLLVEPNPDDALVASIAEVYNADRAKFNKLASEHTKKHAKP